MVTGPCWLCGHLVQTAPGSSSKVGSRAALVAGIGEGYRLGYRIEASDVEALICDACIGRQVLEGERQRR
jgi:hypothetical protein